MAGMYIIQLLMKSWNSWRNEFALWIKMKRLEEEVSRGLGREYPNDVITDVHGSDLENLGTRVLSGNRNVFR
jgi:hypothetical protein